jgi:hypothetical protein
MLVPVEIGPRHIAALERLALLERGERDKACIAWAVSRFLDAAPPVSALGDAPIFERQHGNFRHGHYSKRGIEGMREVRLLARILRHGLWHIPLPGAPRRTPLGWSAYRAAGGSRAHSQP